MNKQFSKIQNKKSFIEWVMRQYFDKEKNLHNPWFNFEVNESNVLDYISESKNKFPLTPMKIVDMWKSICSFKKDYKNSEKEINTIHEQILKKEKDKKEYTLSEVGVELGGITATMINRLSTRAMNKFQILTFDKHFDCMTEDELDMHFNAIMSYRNKAADKYINFLKKSEGDLNKFINFLIKEQLITNKEKDLIEPREYEVLIELFSLPAEDIKQFLLYDIERDDNLLKTYQSMVSHETFPAKKRGRPKKL